MGVPYSLYLHIPFCSHRCAYCDFNTYAGQERSIPAYVEALCRELEHVGRRAPNDMLVHTVYFGGGTPSLLSPSQVSAILGSMRGHFALAADAEISLEANPGTVDPDSLRALRSAGVNRLSLGVQSANGEELRMLERAHSFGDVLNAMHAARRAGFANVNADLIYGLPEQRLATWQVTVKRVLDLAPEHISAYALTLEHGTPFGKWARRGMLAAPDPDLAADMYEWASDALEAAGYSQYEISNWAKDAHECRHNLQYWRGLPYLGFGAGAHGYAGGYRYSDVRRIETYIERLTGRGDSGRSLESGSSGVGELVEGNDAVAPAFPLSPAVLDQHRQSTDDDIADFMIMGMRLTREGIAASTFQRRFGKDLRKVFGTEIERLRGLGLVEVVSPPEVRVNAPRRAPTSRETIRLSRRGRLLGNQVFARFVD
jgi:putative oxygen-independent coproporphyrinogen III oxidase